MKTIISFFSRGSGESGKGRAQFTGSFDEYWAQHHRNIERLCETFELTEDDKRDFIRLTLRSGALAFYDDTTRTSTITYSCLVQSFHGRYDSQSPGEDKSKIIAGLTLSGTRPKDCNDHTAIKTLIEKIEMLPPIAAIRDRDTYAKSRTLLQAVSVEACYVHAEAKLTYPYDFASVVDALHASIRAVYAHQSHEKSPSSPAAILL